MKFLTVCLVFAILGLSLSTVTPTSASFTSSSFNSTPSKVYDYTNATAASGMTQKDSASLWQSVGYPSILFTAGNTTNDTIYGFGTVYTSAFVVTAVIKRTINATIAAWGNDTTEAAVSVADTTATLSFTGKGALKFAAGGGYYAVAGVSTASPTTNPDILQVYLINGASSTSVITRTIAAATSTTTTTIVSGTTSSTITTSTFAIDSLWNEDGYFYVLYETQQTVVICSGTSCGTVVSTTNSATGLMLQGFSVSSTTNMYTAAVSVASGLTESVTTLNVAVTGAIGAGSNSTQSTYILVQWKQTSSSVLNLYAAILNRADGTFKSAAASIVADTTTAINQPGGFISSNYTYGLIYTTRTGSASPYTYTQSALYNGTVASASAAALSNISVSSAVTYPSFNGFRYTTGFGVVAAVTTSSSPATVQYVLGSFFANATFNGTASTTLGTNVGIANGFTDINGAVWFAYSTYDSGSTAPYTPYTSYVGKLVGSINNAMAATTTGANVLATFAALVSFVVLSLFVF